MVSRNVRVRTPRKEKVWASNLLTDTIPDGGATFGIAGGLLDNFYSDRGITLSQSITVMRIIGHLRLYSAGQVATTAVNAKVRWGLTWLGGALATASDGDGQIPRPGNATRETPWIQRGVLFGEEPVTTAPPTGATLSPVETSYLKLDITQQRKQPTVDAKLVLVWDCLSTVEANTVAIEWEGHVMIALP